MAPSGAANGPMVAKGSLQVGTGLAWSHAASSLFEHVNCNALLLSATAGGLMVAVGILGVRAGCSNPWLAHPLMLAGLQLN